MNRNRLLSPLVLAPTIAVLVCLVGLFAISPGNPIERLLTTQFSPHSVCYVQQPEIMWLHVVADGSIALAYFIIPVGLVYFVANRRGFHFRSIFWLFGAFILLCGITHILSIYSIWHGTYVFTGVVKLATGAVSLATAGYLIQHIPAALEIPFPNEMRRVESTLRNEAETRRDAERRLESREEQFAAILKGGLDAFLLAGSDDHSSPEHPVILEANELAEQQTGFTKAQLLGRPLEAAFPKRYQLGLHGLIRESQQRKESIYREVEIGSDGERSQWLYLKAVPAGGATALFFADISDKKWAEAERHRALERQTEAALRESEASAARARAALESAAHGILILDDDRHIIESNRQARAYFGYEKDELRNRPAESLVPGLINRTPETATATRETPAPSDEDKQPLHAYRKDGSSFPVEVRLNPFQTPGQRYVMASVLDISERVAAREALEAKNQEVEQMLYAVSHDLKAPLVSIQGLTRLLTDTHRVEDPQTVAILDEVEKSARQMGDLISDLLEMSRVGHTEERTEPVEVEAVVEDVMSMLQIESEKVGCDWTVHRPLPTLFASRKRIVQLMQNLCSNVLKYGCGGYVRRVEIGVQQTDNTVDIYVQDFGAGIEPSQQESVFEPFTRLNRHVDGTGIGLAIVSRIMAHYGGAVELTSRKGQGARFTLRFPNSLLKAPPAQISAPARPVAPSMEPPRYAPLQRARSQSLENNYLTQFVYAAAHDLHSPMVTISGQLGFLQEIYGPDLPNNAKRLLANSIEAADNMADYIKLLVEFSGVLLGKRAFKEFDPRSAYDEAIVVLGEQIQATKAEITVGSFPNAIKGDREMFSLLIRHLLSNSLKFILPAQTPKIRIEADETESHWRFSVIDQGIGISEGNRELAFKPFQKLNRRAEYPGSGIGLTICRKVVEAHNGTIWIDPGSGQGTTIRFTLGK